MTYLELGWSHIISLQAGDHLLFLLLLILPLYQKRFFVLLKLVTAFTIGHAITIFVSMSNMPSQLVYITELLIPITIITTGMKSLFQSNDKQNISISYYLLIGVFGLIHGSGFAASIKDMMMSQESVVVPLLQFNIGVEFGQIVVLAGLAFCMKWLHRTAVKNSQSQFFELFIKGTALFGILMAVWMVFLRW